MTYFPAEPGTWLIDMDPDIEPVPIIGWVAVGNTAYPILPTSAEPVSGQAYRLARTGAVVDPEWGRTFESEEAWRTALGRSAPYEPGTPLFSTAPEKPKAKAKATASSSSSVAAAAVPNVPGVELLTFGNKSYKSKSFWLFRGGPAPFLFEIPGETPIPTNEDAEKITRTKFFEMRKNVTVAAVDPDSLLGSAEPDEEEPGDFEDDDDDIDGMV